MNLRRACVALKDVRLTETALHVGGQRRPRSERLDLQQSVDSGLCHAHLAGELVTQDSALNDGVRVVRPGGRNGSETLPRRANSIAPFVFGRGPVNLVPKRVRALELRQRRMRMNGIIAG